MILITAIMRGSTDRHKGAHKEDSAITKISYTKLRNNHNILQSSDVEREPRTDNKTVNDFHFPVLDRVAVQSSAEKKYVNLEFINHQL